MNRVITPKPCPETCWCEGQPDCIIAANMVDHWCAECGRYRGNQDMCGCKKVTIQ